MKLMPVLPIKAAKDEEKRKENTESFKAAFIDILKDAGLEPEAPMLDPEGTKT
jgi:hypothetical protein